MSDSAPLSEEEQTELVAFLDGELEEDAARKIETRIVSDPVYRAQANALKKSWELLDFLPQAQPSATFSQATLERIPGLKSSRQLGRISPQASFRRVLALAGSLLVLFGAGYGGARYFGFAAKPGEKQLLKELRLIENKRLYELAGDMEFLQELDHPDLFGNDPSQS